MLAFWTHGGGEVQGDLRAGKSDISIVTRSASSRRLGSWVHTRVAMSDDAPSTEDLPETSGELFASDMRDFHSLLHTGDVEGLVAALENPELYRLACDDARYTEIAMQGIAVLAWSVPAVASEFLVRFDVERSRQDPKSSARRAARTLMAALEWRQLEAEPASPLARAELLRNFLRLYPAIAEDGVHATRLRADLRDRPEVYADLFAYLHQRAQVLPRWITNLVAEGGVSAATSDVLSEPVASPKLSESQRLALEGTLAELRTSLRSRVAQYFTWLVAAALVVALPTALGALLGLLLLGASFALGETRAYQTAVRPRLIHLAIEHGVGAQQVVTSIYNTSAKVGRVGNFDIKIENDHALDLLAALSFALRSVPGAPASPDKRVESKARRDD